MTTPDTTTVAVVDGRPNQYDLTFADPAITGRVRVKVTVIDPRDFRVTVKVSPPAKKAERTARPADVLTAADGTAFIDPLRVQGVPVRGEVAFGRDMDADDVSWQPTWTWLRTADMDALPADVQTATLAALGQAVTDLLTKERMLTAYLHFYEKQQAKALAMYRDAKMALDEATSSVDWARSELAGLATAPKGA